MFCQCYDKFRGIALHTDTLLCVRCTCGISSPPLPDRCIASSPRSPGLRRATNPCAGPAIGEMLLPSRRRRQRRARLRQYSLASSSRPSGEYRSSTFLLLFFFTLLLNYFALFFLLCLYFQIFILQKKLK